MDPEPVIPVYAKLCSGLQDSPIYRQIGQNDLWIAAVAVSEQRPLVTRNVRHFDHIPDLQCEVLEPIRSR